MEESCGAEQTGKKPANALFSVGLQNLLMFHAYPSYFTFFPPIANAGFPASELAVAETFAFSCFGFLASLFPRLLPLAMMFPF